MMKEYNSNLIEGPIGKNLFIFSLPILGGNILQTLNGTINSIWVGNFLGASDLTATVNANIIVFFLISITFGIGMATTILVGQSIGANDTEQAKRVVGTSFSFFHILGFAISIIGILFSPTILKLLNTPADAFESGVIYLRITFVGILPIFTYNYFMMILRGAGDSKTPFYYLLISTVLDIILNPLLIFGLGPIPRMGIAGSATAAVIAQFISLALLIAHVYRKKHFLRLEKTDLHLLRMERSLIGILLRKGLPMGLQMIIVSGSGLVLINLVNSFGSMASAAYGASVQLSNYVAMPAMAIGAAVSTLVAQNIGANRWDRVHRTAITGVLFNLIMTGVIVLIIYIFNRQAISLFLDKVDAAEAIELGIRINLITLWGFIVFGVNVVLMSVVRANGAVIVPLLMPVIALWIMRIPIAYILAPKYGLDSIWWGFPIGFVSASILAILYYFFGNWKKAKMFA